MPYPIPVPVMPTLESIDRVLTRRTQSVEQRIAEAVKAEREACAGMVDEAARIYAKEFGENGVPVIVSNTIATALRAERD